MFESLFGAEMPLAVRFFLAFLIVLGLIGATAWAIRRFGTGRLGNAGARGRQPRLAVIDYATVDARRRLILVRRDNVEHLVMIGGPVDVVVESNIVRAVAARPTAVEAVPRAIPLPESGNGAWPMQPEALAPPPRVAPKIEAEEPAGVPLQPAADAPPTRPHRDTLAALAEELSTRPVTPPPRARNPIPPRQAPPESPRQAPPDLPRAPAPAPAAPAAAVDASTDQSLAEMAQRLEAALRKPGAETREAREPRMPAPPPRAAAAKPPADEQTAEPTPPSAPTPPITQPRVPRAAEPRPLRAEPKPSKPTTLYDNLEQEMANLLGRPPSKTG